MFGVVGSRRAGAMGFFLLGNGGVVMMSREGEMGGWLDLSIGMPLLCEALYLDLFFPFPIFFG
jgi:hypothetical protein